MSANITKTALPPSQAYERTTDRLQQVHAHMGSINGTSGGSAFNADVVPQAPEDPLFGLMAAFRKDTDPKKVDLGIGAYRDNNAKPWVLPVVKQVSNQFAVIACRITAMLIRTPPGRRVAAERPGS